MSYILIDEKAWIELQAFARTAADKIRRMKQHLFPVTDTGWIDTADACQWLNISKRTLQHYRDSGKIPYSFIGKKCYYKTVEIKAMLDKGFTAKKF